MHERAILHQRSRLCAPFETEDKLAAGSPTAVRQCDRYWKNCPLQM